MLVESFIYLYMVFFIFIQMRLKFAEIYGIHANKLTFEFDGEKLSNTDTPDSCDMEDEYMIDVKVGLNFGLRAFCG